MALLRTRNFLRFGVNRVRTSLHVKRVLLARPAPSSTTSHSVRRINTGIQFLGEPSRYLEIGVNAGLTFEHVQADLKMAVDPLPLFDISRLPSGSAVFEGTSDLFFETSPRQEWDVIFVDGLHLFEQAYRDVLNSLSCLSADGLIVLDDSVPENSYTARRDPAILEPGGSTAWHGDVFRVVLLLSRFHPEVDYRTISESPCQTLIWLKEDFQFPSEHVISQRCEEVLALSYDSVFSNRLPIVFRSCGEVEAFRAWRVGQ